MTADTVDARTGASLLVIAKAPVPGRVKTRLCPPLDPGGAAAVAGACLLDTLEVAARVPALRHVLVFDGDPDPWRPPGWEVVAQRGDGLGQRLANAFADVAGPAVLIAMDTPQLSPTSLCHAIGSLARPGTAVLGRTEDGGYWAIGLPGDVDPVAVFDGIPMSTIGTGEAQHRRLGELGLKVVDLEVLRDIDLYEDLAPVAALVPDRRFGRLMAGRPGPGAGPLQGTSIYPAPVPAAPAGRASTSPVPLRPEALMITPETSGIDISRSGTSARTGPLVSLIGPEDAPLLLRDLYAGGDPGPIVAALAQVPELCQATLPFVGAALGPSSVGIRLKEIAILRTSALLGCRYCVDTHTVVAHDAAGFDGDQLCLLRAETDDSSSIDDPVEIATLRWVDAVAAGRGPLPVEVEADASRHLSDHHLVELTTTVGATMFLNRFATALRLPTSPATVARLADLGLGAWQPKASEQHAATVADARR